MDPTKTPAVGLSKKAVASLGIGVPGLSAEEKKHRQALKAKILADAEPYNESVECFPGLGPHPGFPTSQQLQIKIPEKLMRDVAAKIVRGCEYTMGQKRIVDHPYEIEIFFADPSKVEGVLKQFGQFGPVQLGPGFAVRRAAALEDPLTVLYKIDVWEAWTIYASIMNEAPHVEQY